MASMDELEPPGGTSDLEWQELLSDAVLVGFVLADIVGLRHYSGVIRGREMVGLVREPLNPYDPNAIKVLNTRTVQVGHIQRGSAAALAPLIDSHLVTVEAIVPKPPSKNRNPYRLPCQIHLFARPDAIPIVRAAVSEGGLELIEYGDHEFGLSEAVIIQEESSKKSKSGKGSKSVDEIFALVRKVDEGKFAPLEPPKDIILSELFEHQKEGLGWLVGRENSSDLPPFWEARNGTFVNVLTNHETSERPETLKGGIFADDMGLGKTLTLLSLIATDKCGGFPSSSSSSLQEEHERLRSSSSRKSGKKTTAPRKRRKLDGGSVTQTEDALRPKTTLVVCPPSVFTSWITQLEEHTMPGSLKVYLYHGDRTQDPAVLLQHDIVMTTYATLSAEFNDSNSPMKEIEWYRVILDEAHLIKNSAAKQTKAVIALKSERRWAVTGTPIQNSSFDLFSLMAFLKFQPFAIKSYWQNLIERPLYQRKKSGIARLQALIGTISLRRTKYAEDGSGGVVGLPRKTIVTCYVNLSAEELEFYDHIESEAQNTLREYLDTDTLLRNYSTVLHILLRLRQICNDMELCPSDIQSFLPPSALEDVSQNPELLKKLASLVDEGDDFDCPVCLSPPQRVVITCCAHIFCQACILKTLKQVNARCPICRHSLSKTDLFVVPQTKSFNDDMSKAHSRNRPLSSKVTTLLKLLLADKEQNPLTKSVIFSQFRKMLILLQEPLKEAGFVVLQLDGSMSTKKRTEVIKKFTASGPGTPMILLASLKAAGAGINLAAASRVYLFEPWWNPAVEEQAMDRVHRIGQREEVKVVRMIVKDSIEERILMLQEKKKSLASGAFGKKSTNDQQRMRIEDLRIMMHI
ncbi:putative SWI/SNF-related matrix-associated actin-dependent regulator of chromatin subfamily A member 3-like 1 [Zingiber officinale]|uniref:putative SWI/SNF-related matrix-associated actin-dependent regulator of chromatin subfamily A member 3-like 1 n=1 Tax=Zingiber officinale TaxID=94328 RepID=UPI001C4D40CA|nr:putative SWI/SNF-related matrix-associated actin-dependent regulator of chromatin subfamily A member 3-like 1 [Zingiber officinale]XP_042457248.1 putative SWI/SNF-related matrix-associated actin-dependent regulator of chromatin subfamily A member 3-like 1 [Zingiber officinale]